jgi:D-3-phosphoglycerate dehydrogenase
MMKILVTSKSFGEYNPQAIKLLEEHGFEIIRSDTANPNVEDICRQIKGVDVLIVGNDTIDASVINAADKLKLIHMHGTGLDAIDVKSATKNNIYVANTPGANKNAVAEMIVLQMLAVGRKLNAHVELLKTGEWKRYAGHELSNSTVGIIGMGNIGRRVVELLSGFNVSMIAYDPVIDTAWADEHRVEFLSDIDAIFRQADWLVLSLPLTDKTKYLVNQHTLSLMKPTAYLINAARGELIDEDALCQAISEKWIAGAALDTFIDEPPPINSPIRLSGVLMTPHIGATSIETSATVSQMVAQNIVDILIYKEIKSAVNAEKIN